MLLQVAKLQLLHDEQQAHQRQTAHLQQQLSRLHSTYQRCSLDLQACKQSNQVTLLAELLNLLLLARKPV